jgi:hypothetical protein
MQAAPGSPLGVRAGLPLRRGNRISGGREGGLDRIADRLKVDAVIGCDGRVEHCEMALNGSSHRSPIPLPERSATFDVSKEEGDGAGGKIGHDPLQTLG